MSTELLADEAPDVATEQAAGAAAAAQAPETAPPVPTGPTCPKCETPLDVKKASWCRSCGYYPQLGRFVELDPVEPEEEAKATSPVAVLQKIPGWAWLLGGGVLALVAISVTVRLVTSEDSSARMIWSIGQVGCGFMAVACAHICCYLFAIMENDGLNLLDIVLKPLAIWSASVKDLPHSFRRVAAGLWGSLAIVLAVAVVGGIPWEDLWDWGGKAAAKKNLVHAITKQARAAGDNGNDLEGAIKDFAGEAGADDLKNKKKKPDGVIVRRLRAECLVLGYLPSGPDDFSGLLLASVVENRLRFVGVVREGIPPEVREQLNLRMRELSRPEPFVRCPFEGNYVAPSIVCKVKFKEWTGNLRLSKPEFVELLEEVELGAR